MVQVSILALVVLAIASANVFTQAQTTFQKQALDAHNQLRARHCAAPLVLDNTLNQKAQAYAQYLASNNRFEHSNNGYGENLYMMSSSASLAGLHGNKGTQSWYDEIKDYSFNRPGFTMATGHFTQVVWKGTKRLGCGVAYANSDRKAVVVCNYDPPGNYQGQFPQNVAPAQC